MIDSLAQYLTAIFAYVLSNIIETSLKSVSCNTIFLVDRSVQLCASLTTWAIRLRKSMVTKLNISTLFYVIRFIKTQTAPYTCNVLDHTGWIPSFWRDIGLSELLENNCKKLGMD